MTVFEKLKEDCLWIKELIRENKITININHCTNLKVVLTDDKYSLDKKYEMFLEKFAIGLEYARIENINQVISFPDFCFECGEYVSYLFENNTISCGQLSREKDDDIIKILPIECDTISQYNFEIDFPTGQIVCVDRLPHVQDILEVCCEMINVNSNKGLRQQTLFYAKHNIFHVFVGNTCPSVFINNDDRIGVGHSHTNKYFYPNGSSSCDCGSKNCDCEIQLITPIEDGKQIANICTDLWWATIVDLEVYKKLLIKEFGKNKAIEYLKDVEPIDFKIKPGKYLCTYLNAERDYETPKLYADLKLIKKDLI